jgi:two-component system, cell cycle response regulator
VSTTVGVCAFLGPQPETTSREGWREVLVVDDDPAILRLTAAILEGAGYSVTVTTDGEQAMECIQASPPDFLITDWKMPGVDGIELCKWVRQLELSKYIYILVFTARTETRHMVEAISAGADDFFSKPVRPGELLSRMQAGLRILERERRLTWLTRFDHLTEVLARSCFFAELDGQWERSVSEGRPLACVMVNVDDFKRVNDAYGHLIGDEALKAVARVLSDCAGNYGCVGRYGGEEFCVVLPNATEDDAWAWTEGCRAKLASTTVAIRGAVLEVTASFGISERSNAADTPNHMLDRADQSLLMAKRRGKNCVFRSRDLTAGEPDPPS